MTKRKRNCVALPVKLAPAGGFTLNVVRPRIGSSCVAVVAVGSATVPSGGDSDTLSSGTYCVGDAEAFASVTSQATETSVPAAIVPPLHRGRSAVPPSGAGRQRTFDGVTGRTGGVTPRPQFGSKPTSSW